MIPRSLDPQIARSPLAPVNGSRIAATALTLWNDVILQTAITHKLPTIELRQIFTSPADYANPIEPSAAGSDKISGAILHVVKTHDFTQPKAIVYGG